MVEKRIESIRNELKEMAEKEAHYLWRMARRAWKHGCSKELINKIREEANWCHTTAKAYPDRLIHWKSDYDLKFAFKHH